MLTTDQLAAAFNAAGIDDEKKATLAASLVIGFVTRPDGTLISPAEATRFARHATLWLTKQGLETAMEATRQQASATAQTYEEQRQVLQQQAQAVAGQIAALIAAQAAESAE